MATEKPERVKLEFYALGKLERNQEKYSLLKSNRGISDRSANLLERNALSLNSKNLENIRNNYKSIHTLKDVRIDTNNYMNPIHTYNSKELYSVDKDMNNKETFNIAREKYFANDKNITLNPGNGVTKEEFNKRKNETLNGRSSFPLINTGNTISFNGTLTERLDNNNLYFDKNNKEMIRYPKGFWNFNSDKMNRTKISDEAPEWFHVITESKKKKWDDTFIKNEETLSVFSRYQKWITVTPKNKNRRKPLEKIKIVKMDETSKIMPNWMQIKINMDNIKVDPMKSTEYQSIRNSKKLMVLVDKELNDKKKNLTNNDVKSVFSIGDYRHNLTTKENADYYSSKVSQLPKQFLTWNDNTEFHPKLKKDIYSSKIKK